MSEADGGRGAGDDRPGIPNPEDCARRPVPRGTAVLMGDGRVWTLADHVPILAPCFDRLYDGNVLRGQYAQEDIQVGASHLLRANYELPTVAVATLIGGADAGSLVEAVEVAMFGPLRQHVTWSEWMLTSLYAAGLDPASIPPERLRGVMSMLVATGRAVPPGKFVSSAMAAPRLASLRAHREARARDEAQTAAPTEAS